MLALTAYLNQLADFALPAAQAKTRLQALQPEFDGRDILDLEYFLVAR